MAKIGNFPVSMPMKSRTIQLKKAIFESRTSLMPKSQNSFLIVASRLISNIFNPLTALLVYFVYFSYQHYTWEEMLHRFWPILLIVALPVSFWIVWNVKKGNYSNMDVSNRNQRKSLYVVIGIVMLVYLIVFYMMNKSIDTIMPFLLILLFLMQISNYFIKSSMHTAFNVITAAFFFNQDVKLGVLWLIIAIIVGLTRIVLKRHTLSEVLMGGFLAAAVSAIYIYYH